MGVAPTGAIFKGLTFDGESSKNYGIYITGSAVFNAPARDVEMVTIPGRNGTFALDRGRFENIEVTYPAGLYGDTEADFAQGISDFRNFLASRQGYVELSDDYNPGEYRLAVYKNGLDVTPEQLKAGEFEIVFECKPQRFLTSGEDEIAVTSGDTITNPTLFESRPMLQVWGYGSIDIDGQEVAINAAEIGMINLAPQQSFPQDSTVTVYIQLDNMGLLNAGDDIYIRKPLQVSRYVGFSYDVTNATCNNSNIFLGWSYRSLTIGVRRSADTTIVAGTATTIFNESGTVTVSLSNGTNVSLSVTFSMNVTAAGLVSMMASVTGVTLSNQLLIYFSGVDGYSTQSALGSPIYFDLDIGEAYKIEGGVPVSVNNAVTIPAILPTLKSGGNTITFDNTITQFKVVPRWWKV